jgi:outer membrane lipoprotein-sorting protein
MKIKVLTLTILVGLMVAFALWAVAQDQLTGDQILERVEEQSITGGGPGSVVAEAQFDIVTSEGEEQSYKFKIFVKREEGQPEKQLIVYLEPELVRGTMMLSIKPKGEEARIWMYMPALGQVKELVTEQEKGAKFAGSNLTQEEVGEGFKLKDDYNAEIIGQEVVKVGAGAVEMPAYILNLAPKEGADVDWQSIKMWVHKEKFVILRAEFTNKDGELERVLEGDDYYEDEVGFISHKVVVKNVLDNSSTTITLASREKREIPNEYFDPQNLPNLDIESM